MEDLGQTVRGLELEAARRDALRVVDARPGRAHHFTQSEMKAPLPSPTALSVPFGAAVGLLVFLTAAVSSCGSLIVVTDADGGAAGGNGADGSSAAGSGGGAGGPGGASGAGGAQGTGGAQGAGGAPAVTVRLTGTIEAVGQIASPSPKISIVNAGLTYDRTRICNPGATLCVSGGVVP
jgi:hypothetical protein